MRHGAELRLETSARCELRLLSTGGTGQEAVSKSPGRRGWEAALQRGRTQQSWQQPGTGQEAGSRRWVRRAEKVRVRTAWRQQEVA